MSEEITATLSGEEASMVKSLVESEVVRRRMEVEKVRAYKDSPQDEIEHFEERANFAETVLAKF